MWMMAAGATLLAACTMEVDGQEKAPSEQSQLAADELTPDQSMATEAAVSGSHAGLAADALASAKSSAIDGVIHPRIPCRRVTATSVPVFSSPNGSGVLCRFFQGDVFTNFGQVLPSGRYINWCPRGVPPAQGTEGFVQAAGTVASGC
jgi:hypothetical protein